MGSEPSELDQTDNFPGIVFANQNKPEISAPGPEDVIAQEAKDLDDVVAVLRDDDARKSERREAVKYTVDSVSRISSVSDTKMRNQALQARQGQIYIVGREIQLLNGGDTKDAIAQLN